MIPILTASICPSRSNHWELNAISHIIVLSLLQLSFCLCLKPFWLLSPALAYCPSFQSWSFFTDLCLSFFTEWPCSTCWGASNMCNTWCLFCNYCPILFVESFTLGSEAMSLTAEVVVSVFLFKVEYSIIGIYFPLSVVWGHWGILFSIPICILHFQIPLPALFSLPFSQYTSQALFQVPESKFNKHPFLSSTRRMSFSKAKNLIYRLP